MGGVVDRFPASWRCDVVVTDAGGKTSDGDPLPDVERTVRGCLLAVSSTADADLASDIPEVRAVLSMPAGTRIASTAFVRTPPGAVVVGLWKVDGEPGVYPLGTTVNLVKEADGG